MPFVDRRDAGRRLAEVLLPFRGEDVIVLGLPRGGVPVAFEIAQALDAPLDVIVVRKLGVPFQPELGMGAIGEDWVRVINDDVVRMARVSPEEIADVEERERAELERRAHRLRGRRSRIPLTGRTAIVVDDGIATGSTARVACEVARAQGAKWVVFAVPVGPADSLARLGDDADEVVCLETPEPFFAIGEWYADFTQISDEEVLDLLERAERRPRLQRGETRPSDAAVPDPVVRDEEVEVHAGRTLLGGYLTVPEGARGVVVFVHGSGSSRHSPRNRFVASVLNRAGLGTLLFDLLTPAEEVQRENVFDIELLVGRLVEVTRWLRDELRAHDVRIGYFGASTGAAAALWAAAEPDADVAAVVSRGGRPDLAARRLDAVQAPTLLIVGSRDHLVLDLNRQAQARLRCPNRLIVVPGATHLFEEPGALSAVADHARDWFAEYLAAAPQTA